jgi:pimeloyl-ACP methyl ester carboxylesterase
LVINVSGLSEGTVVDALPLVLVPGLNCSARLYAPQITALWRFGPVTVANHTRDDTIDAIARRILAAAPPRFALVGLSMGGYIAFEMVRQARERVAAVALLDTSARPESPEQTVRRRAQMALAESGRFAEVPLVQFPALVHPDRHGDAELKRIIIAMAEDTGPEAFLRQERAIIARSDCRPLLAQIACPTLVLVGDSDALTPPDHAREIADGIRGARLAVIPNCGHLTTLERPDEVTAALIDWLEKTQLTG